jgi:beta-lactamase class A
MTATRRNFIAGAAALAGGGLSGARAWDDAERFGALAAQFARLEREIGGRLGVAVLNAGSRASVGLRADERFPLCSTFKLLAAAAILKRVDAGAESLDRRIGYRREDLVAYSPITRHHVGAGMPLADLCEAAMTRSDNTAGNLMLAALGGPRGVTAFARAIGDAQTRLDRIEPELNEAAPGDARDTTTPAAMGRNIRALVLGDVLSPASRRHLTRWMVENKTGGTRLRAGAPAGWRVGDKTGTGERGTSNDVGVVWPPGGTSPLVVAVYLTGSPAAADKRDAAIAAVARAVAAAVT